MLFVTGYERASARLATREHESTMTDTHHPIVSHDFATSLGLLVELEGWMPRMAGRILGILLDSEDPLTQAQLSELSGASIATVSTMTRQLTEKQLVERVVAQNERALYYRARPDIWSAMETESLRSIRRYIAVADEGLAADPGNARLEAMRKYFSLVEERCLHVLSELEQSHQVKAR